MFVPELIQRKRDNGHLSHEEIAYLLRGYTDGSIPDYQMSALLMAFFFRGMDDAELTSWAGEMLRSGEVLDFSDIPAPNADKHSTGGVGDKISLILIGQTGSICPADKKLYALRDVTSTVECIPLIASSIMSKKLAEGINALVLDVKVGDGAFMKTPERARLLATTMIAIGKAAGVRVTALLTQMDEPLGAAIGNSLEVIESVEVLRGGGPADIRELTLLLSAEMLLSVGRTGSIEEARELLVKNLDSGAAYEKWCQLVTAHGGDVAAIHDLSRMPQAAHVTQITAARSGTVVGLACERIGRAAVVLGAGRAKAEDSVDPAVGFYWRAPIGAELREGDVIAELHWNDEARRDACIPMLRTAISYGDKAVKPPLLIDRLDEVALTPTPVPASRFQQVRRG
jgi:pyrimidine-nucleoside phosphorylase